MKLLPIPFFKSVRIRGFTLVELLVVIAIIAILAVIAIVFFGNIPGKARDARLKSNVDAVSKALELKYDPDTGTYGDITAGDFSKSGAEVMAQVAAGKITKTITAGGTGFTVCATLETSTTPYCVGAAQGGTVAFSGPTPTPVPTPTPSSTPLPTPSPTPSPSPSPVACAVFNNLTAGGSQACDVGSGGSASTMFVKCTDLQTAGNGGNYDCAKICTWLPNGAVTSVPWYSSATATTTTGTTSFMSSPCAGVAVTVTLRGP